MNLIVKNISHRTEMVLGGPALERLAASKVVIFGVGGVGSWCAEALVRSGVLDLTIVDSDIICATNINRQLQATSQNVGQVKVEELAARLRLINPAASISAINRAYDESSDPDFGLAAFDFVIDAIDSLKNKILLIQKTQEAAAGNATGHPILFSSMGAAAKVDPGKIRTASLDETQVCPLAKHVRRVLRERGIPTAFQCVYSYEHPIAPQAKSYCGTDLCTCTRDRRRHNEGADPAGQASDWCARKRRINGSLVHITGIFGFMLAGLVIQEVKNPVRDSGTAPR